MTITAPTPTRARRTSTYATQLCALLTAAFALSAVHTVYSYVTGIEDKSFTVTTPVAWVFYALGFAAAAVARLDRRWVDVALPAYLSILIAVAVFYYPTTFRSDQQTVFGWFENDVYTGLLMVALYLAVFRLRRTSLAP